jgi:hypothetical protein
MFIDAVLAWSADTDLWNDVWGATSVRAVILELPVDANDETPWYIPPTFISPLEMVTEGDEEVPVEAAVAAMGFARDTPL